MIDSISTHSFRDLPFIENDAWSPGASGDYVSDCQLGRTHAQIMLDMIQDTQSPTIYGAVARCIALAGVWTGVEVGFHHRLAEAML